MCAVVMIQAGAAFAASVPYGSFGPDYPPGVLVYKNVVESSGTDPVPMFNAPTINGDSLDFDPTNFVASSGGGGADVTQGQLNFTLTSLPLTGVTSFEVEEKGNYTLVGAGTPASLATSGLIVAVDILAVDGNTLDTPISFNVSAATSFSLPVNSTLISPWSLGLTVDFVSVLNEEEIVYEWGVSAAKIVITNTLVALSEPGTAAVIAKTDFQISPSVIIDPEFVIPEPASLSMMGLALAGFGAAFRRRLWRRRR